MSATAPSAHVFLTGATGFLGKVVLEELLHRREALGIARVCVLVRPEKGHAGRVTSPRDRFRKVLRSEVFHRLAPGWESFIEVIGGDLEQPRCGIEDGVFEALAARTTHVIHCAASVDFDLPVRQAAASNSRRAPAPRKSSRRRRAIRTRTPIRSAWPSICCASGGGRCRSPSSVRASSPRPGRRPFRAGSTARRRSPVACSTRAWAW